MQQSPAQQYPTPPLPFPLLSHSTMRIPYELALGWRYTRAGRATRRNGFISFISGVSMLGIALGVAALIIVLSVMNGFQKEVRDRMLGVVSHIEIFHADGGPFPDLDKTMAQAQRNPEVVGAAPFIAAQSLLARGEDMRGALIRGIDPAREPQVTDLAASMGPALAKLVPGQWGIVLGAELAQQLGVREGDPLTMIAPGGQVTPAGVVPRLKQMTVVGTFDSGHFEYDSGLALLHEDDAARIFRLEAPTGIRLKLRDLHRAPEVAAELRDALGNDYVVRDWTQQNRTWFAAVQVEKRMMFIILTLIVAVAAFNLVSTLVMTVTDKRADIAILRTLGASPGSIMGIFVVQGAAVGVIGTLAGLLLGLVVAFNIDIIVPALEHLFHASFLPRDIYLISRMPSDPQRSDIMPIAIISLVLAFVATLYPSWRASRVNPAEALRYE
jgi:lipoprotein-releasing system permease protein